MFSCILVLGLLRFLCGSMIFYAWSIVLLGLLKYCSMIFCFAEDALSTGSLKRSHPMQTILRLLQVENGGQLNQIFFNFLISEGTQIEFYCIYLWGYIIWPNQYDQLWYLLRWPTKHCEDDQLRLSNLKMLLNFL